MSTLSSHLVIFSSSLDRILLHLLDAAKCDFLLHAISRVCKTYSEPITCPHPHFLAPPSIRAYLGFMELGAKDGFRLVCVALPPALGADPADFGGTQNIAQPLTLGTNTTQSVYEVRNYHRNLSSIISIEPSQLSVITIWESRRRHTAAQHDFSAPTIPSEGVMESQLCRF